MQPDNKVGKLALLAAALFEQCGTKLTRDNIVPHQHRIWQPERAAAVRIAQAVLAPA